MTDTTPKAFLDELYEKISSVIGGTSEDQYLCLTLPGTIINSKDFEYNDTDENVEKPAHVKANESRLVNKLFDACFVAGGDNGKLLPNQYKTALSMLSPQLNRELYELKSRLREVLMTPYPYDFGEGIVNNMTMEQVFYRLYNDYVEAKSKWNKEQLDMKEKLEKEIIDKVARHDKYLEWYGTVAESARVNLDEKLGKVLGVFSPTDMNIINAILNCGVGGEIEQARSTLSMVEELSPDGGYVYPVNLQPSNWFKLLKSSFTGVDLLESPAALSQKLRTLQLQRKNILGQITKLTSTIPSDEDMAEVKQKLAEANKAYKDKVEACVIKNIDGSVNVVNAIVDMCLEDENGNQKEPDGDTIERVVNKEAKAGKKVKKEDVEKLVEEIGKSGKECMKAQSAAVAAGEACVTAALDWCTKNNRTQLRELLAPLKENLATLNEDIEELKMQIQIARSVSEKTDTADQSEENAADVLPNKSDDYFTQIIINTTASALSTSSSRQASSSSSQTSASFFLGGYSSSSSHSESSESMSEEASHMNIQIGMNIAKVSIERPWFNPGIFHLTGEMFNFSDQRIAPESEVSLSEGEADKIRERFSAMNKSILPAFPVAFVIAKDVSIKFTSDTAISSSFAESVEDKASKGGGFLCFSTNSASASSKSNSSAVANSNANSVTVRFTAPQILGYFMQAVPADKSKHINDSNVKDFSIIGFISDFKRLMSDIVDKNKNADKIEKADEQGV